MGGRPFGERLFALPATTVPLPARVTGTCLRRQLALVPFRPPLGTRWSGHSVRSGAATEAHAVGVDDALLRQLMGLADAETAHRH